MLIPAYRLDQLLPWNFATLSRRHSRWDTRPLTLHRVPAVLARTRIDEFIADHQGQAEGIIEFATGQQSGVGGDTGTVELQLHLAVEIQPQWLIV